MELLKINNLSIKYDGLIASNNINISVERGTITAIIGPNGAGKTTLFNQISGICSPDSGEIFFNGENITGLKPYNVCSKGIARTYQVIKLFNKMSVLDNVLVGMHSLSKDNYFGDIIKFPSIKIREKEYMDNAHNLLKMFGIDEMSAFPAMSLSYGQQRLLEIARALASKPKLLLLDEPAAGMNEKEKQELSATIKNINKMGITILIVEHDMKMIMNIADKIYVLDSGKNLANGTPNEIINNRDVIEAYLGKEGI